MSSDKIESGFDRSLVLVTYSGVVSYHIKTEGTWKLAHPLIRTTLLH